MGAREQIYEFLSAHPEYRSNLGLYEPQKDTLESIKKKIEKVEIKVFSGDWCPDCRVQLPRFFSVLLAMEDEDMGLEIIDVDRHRRDEYGMAEAMSVLALPTFVFFRNGEELGRIIEKPEGRLEEDIAEILIGGSK